MQPKIVQTISALTESTAHKVLIILRSAKEILFSGHDHFFKSFKIWLILYCGYIFWLGNTLVLGPDPE